MTKHPRDWVIAALVVYAITYTASAQAQTNDATPFTCDGKPAKFHVHRAKAIIDKGYAASRIPDDSPMTKGEKARLMDHKFCLRDETLRDRIATYRDKIADDYRELLRVEWLTPKAKALVASISSTLASIRACESGGNYSTDTGNGYYGAYQFDLTTWAGVGGYGSPAQASAAEQDYRAAVLYQQRGSAPWPVCG